MPAASKRSTAAAWRQRLLGGHERERAQLPIRGVDARERCACRGLAESSRARRRSRMSRGRCRATARRAASWLLACGRAAHAPGAPGTAANRVWVYGCAGALKTASVGPNSTISPWRITATRSQTWRGDPQVVGDEQHRQVEALADVVQQAAAPAPAPRRRAPRPARRRSARPGRAPAPGPCRCAGAGRRRIRAGKRSALRAIEADQRRAARGAASSASGRRAVNRAALGDQRCRPCWRGSSEPYGSWNTIWIRLRCCRRPALRERVRGRCRRPGSRRRPMPTRRTMQRATVDLPEPDSPTMPTVSPRRISRSTTLAACTAFVDAARNDAPAAIRLVQAA